MGKTRALLGVDSSVSYPAKNVTSTGANATGLMTLTISEDHRCGLRWAAAGSFIKQDIHNLCSGTAHELLGAYDFGGNLMSFTQQK